MGLRLIASGADYSANNVGYAGLYTSVTNGLKGLYEMRENKFRARHNAAQNGSIATITGNPAFDSQKMQITLANALDTGIKPQNGGYSFAVVMNLRTGTTSGDEVIQSWTSGTTTEGLFRLAHHNRAFSMTVYSYPSQTLPLSGYTSHSLSLTRSTEGYELIVGTATDGDGIRLYRPQAGTTQFSAAAGRFFAFTTLSPTIRTARNTLAANQDVAMFAWWNRPIDATEVNTFYNEIKTQMESYGLAI